MPKMAKMPKKHKKNKTIPTSFEDFNTPQLPQCPHCSSKTQIVKAGSRKLRNENTQMYLCKSCNQRFTNRTIPHTTYPTSIILHSLTYFNLGHTLAQTQTTMQRNHKTKIPISTLNNWVKRFEAELSFIRLRKNYDFDPQTAIHSKKFHHQQIYEFKYHTLKTNFTKRFFPQLKTYITSIHKTPYFIPDTAFKTGPRASQLRIDLKPQKTTKHNNAPRMAELALTLAKTNRERHQIIENFFLANDSTTVAIEVPVYIKPKELTKTEQKEYGLTLNEPLSGHIDILQQRFTKIHILDYKPNANRNDKATIDQLFLYSLALSKRINVPLRNIVAAFFDGQNYFQIQPSEI
jgi:transposase-like protein